MARLLLTALLLFFLRGINAASFPSTRNRQSLTISVPIPGGSDFSVEIPAPPGAASLIEDQLPGVVDPSSSPSPSSSPTPTSSPTATPTPSPSPSPSESQQSSLGGIETEDDITSTSSLDTPTVVPTTTPTTTTTILSNIETTQTTATTTLPATTATSPGTTVSATQTSTTTTVAPSTASTTSATVSTTETPTTTTSSSPTSVSTTPAATTTVINTSASSIPTTSSATTTNPTTTNFVTTTSTTTTSTTTSALSSSATTTSTTTTTSSSVTSTIPQPSPTPSPACPPTCTCQDPGILLGDSSFDETELQKFFSGQSSVWYAVNWGSSSIFRNEWDPNLVQYTNNELTLGVEKHTDGTLHGSAFRTHSHWYGYGCVSSCMKPIPVSGIISSLFMYTGPYDGIGGSTPNQNEIDIEFEGQNTNIVQFNYYTEKAAGGPAQFNEKDYVLGFDASTDFNVYGFQWTPSGIKWYVNGNLAHEVTQSDPQPPPVVTENTVQKVMANAWVVSESIEAGFGGPFDSASFTSAKAAYKWIRYEKLDSNGCCTISSTC